MMNFAIKKQTKQKIGLLPTRQQLAAFLQSKNISPEKLSRMTAWEQVQLAKEYQQMIND